MSTYDVTVTREDGVWFADIDGLPTNTIGATDVPRFADLDLEVRDLIAGLTDAEPDSFDLTWRIMFGDTDVTKLLDELDRVTAALELLEAERADLRAHLIHEGVHAKLSQAVIADVLQISQQRVGQLVSR